MAKVPSSIIGVDLGRHTIKAVALQRRGADRIVVNDYAMRVVGDGAQTVEQLSHHLKLLFRELNTGAKYCAAAASSSQALIRLIDQPSTPVELLREALRL